MAHPERRHEAGFARRVLARAGIGVGRRRHRRNSVAVSRVAGTNGDCGSDPRVRLGTADPGGDSHDRTHGLVGTLVGLTFDAGIGIGNCPVSRLYRQLSRGCRELRPSCWQAAALCSWATPRCLGELLLSVKAAALLVAGGNALGYTSDEARIARWYSAKLRLWRRKWLPRLHHRVDRVILSGRMMPTRCTESPPALSPLIQAFNQVSEHRSLPVRDSDLSNVCRATSEASGHFTPLANFRDRTHLTN